MPSLRPTGTAADLPPGSTPWLDPEQVLSSLLQALPDLLFVFDGNGYIRDIRAHNFDLLLVPPDQAIGRCLQEFLPASEVERHLAQFRQCLETREVVSYDYPLDFPDRRRLFQARLSALDPHRVLALIREVTGERELEQRRLRDREQLNLVADFASSSHFEGAA